MSLAVLNNKKYLNGVLVGTIVDITALFVEWLEGIKLLAKLAKTIMKNMKKYVVVFMEIHSVFIF